MEGENPCLVSLDIKMDQGLNQVTDIRLYYNPNSVFPDEKICDNGFRNAYLKILKIGRFII